MMDKSKSNLPTDCNNKIQYRVEYLKRGMKYFNYRNFYGIYNKSLSYNLSKTIRDEYLILWSSTIAVLQ